jgi:hypothetical protein
MISTFSLFGYLMKLIINKNIEFGDIINENDSDFQQSVEFKNFDHSEETKNIVERKNQIPERKSNEKLMEYKPYSQQYIYKKFQENQIEESKQKEVTNIVKPIITQNETNRDVVNNLTERYNKLKEDVIQTQEDKNVLKDKQRLEQKEIESDAQKLIESEIEYDAQRLQEKETISKNVTKVKETEPPSKE